MAAGVTSTNLGAFANICCFGNREENDYLNVRYQRISSEQGGRIP